MILIPDEDHDDTDNIGDKCRTKENGMDAEVNSNNDNATATDTDKVTQKSQLSFCHF